MAMHQMLLMLSGMLVLTLLLQPLTQRLHLPFPAALVAVGFVGSEIIVALGGDTGLRHDSFHDLIFFVLLPLLVFEAAFKIDVRLLLKNLLTIMVLVLPVLLLSTFVSAALTYYGIGHPGGFPWIAALLTGALLSATDSTALDEVLERSAAPARLRILLDGENLLNDATAIVIFSIFLYMAQHPGEQIEFSDALVRFCVVFFGGMLIGLLVGLGSLFLSRLFHDPVKLAVVTLVSAYSGYLVAEVLLDVSGVMAVLVSGLIMGRVIHKDFSQPGDGFVDQLWGFNAYIANAMMFLLMGTTITLAMFEERWLAMLIGIAGVLIARAVGIFGTAPLLSRLPTVERLSFGYQATLYWGGIRGAVTLALALAIPTDLDYWWTIQSIAFGVVLFTLFVQAPSMGWLLRRYRLDGSKSG